MKTTHLRALRRNDQRKRRALLTSSDQSPLETRAAQRSRALGRGQFADGGNGRPAGSAFEHHPLTAACDASCRLREPWVNPLDLSLSLRCRRASQNELNCHQQHNLCQQLGKDRPKLPRVRACRSSPLQLIFTQQAPRQQAVQSKDNAHARTLLRQTLRTTATRYCRMNAPKPRNRCCIVIWT